MLTHDLRYAVRQLRRSPAFAITAVTTLALAIGANTAVFSLANAILLRPLPYPEPSQLAYINTTATTKAFASISQDGQAWVTIRDHATLLDAAVSAGSFGRGINLVVGQTATIVSQQRVSAGYFHVLGIAPFIGREFTADEDRTNGPTAVILSYSLWQRAFAANPAIAGTQILLRGEPYTVVGVMPQKFVNLVPVDVWTPVRASTSGEGSGTNFEILARPKPGVSWLQANAELASLSLEALKTRFRSESLEPTSARLELRSMQDAQVEEVREPIVMLSAGVGAVLVIACVNLAALLLARGGSRQREIAMRLALGSGRAAVIRQLMTEAIVLAAAGGALGLLVGWFGLDALKALGGHTFEEWQRVTLDARVVGVTMIVSLVTSVVFGLVPALQASRLDVQTALAEGGSRGVAGGSRNWSRRLLVAGESALGVMLLVVAGLLLRTFVNVNSLDPGFDPRRLTTASVSLLDKRYETAESVTHLFDASLARLASTPGIESAAVSLGLPYNRLLNMGFRLTDEPTTSQGLIANVSYVTPGFFKTLGIPLRRGRSIASTDSADSEPVIVVNEAFDRIYSKDKNVLERHIRLAGMERAIVGVVGDVQQRGAGFFLTGMVKGPLTLPPVVYVPAPQAKSIFSTHIWFQPIWSVRASSMSVADPAIRQAIASVDPLLPVAEPESMSTVMADATAVQRLLMTLVGVLAAAAVLLTAIGIHGLIAQGIAERTREFGIRLALGSTTAEAMRQAATPGIVLALIGAAAGALGAIPAVTLVQSFLWGVSARDSATFAGAVALLLIVAAASSALPALRLLRLDPAATLRQ